MQRPGGSVLSLPCCREFRSECARWRNHFREVLKRWSNRLPNSARTAVWPCFADILAPVRTLLEQVLDSIPTAVSAEETHILHDEIPPSQSRLPGPRSVLEYWTPLLQSPAEVAGRTTSGSRSCLWQGNRGTTPDRQESRVDVLIRLLSAFFPETRVSDCAPRSARRLPELLYATAALKSSQLGLFVSGRTVNQSVPSWASGRRFCPSCRIRGSKFVYEDLVHDLEKESRRVLEFLALSWNPAGSVLRARHARRLSVRQLFGRRQPSLQTCCGTLRITRRILSRIWRNSDPFLKLLG